jgi:Ctr copper transporter family
VTKWEFALSWFAVVFIGVAYHAVRYLIYMLEDYMHHEQRPRKTITLVDRELDTSTDRSYQQLTDNLADSKSDQRRHDGTSDMKDDVNEYSRLRQSVESGNREKQIGSTRYLLLRVLHSVLAGYNYGVALVLMLIAMTFNPSLFLALVVGYTFGDFMFFARMKPQSSSIDCH